MMGLTAELPRARNSLLHARSRKLCKEAPILSTSVAASCLPPVLLILFWPMLSKTALTIMFLLLLQSEMTVAIVFIFLVLYRLYWQWVR